MKHLKLFKTQSEFDVATLELPNVTYIVEKGSLNFHPNYDLQYLTIEALEDGLTAQLSTNACEYRVDNGDWTSLTANTNTVSINTGQTLSFKGNLTPSSTRGIGTFTISKKCNVKGNIMSLLYGDDFIDKIDLTDKDWAFYRLFYNCTNLVDASELILPATTLAPSCYNGMFSGCSNLTTAPELPATTLAPSCYSDMFYGCSNLNYIKMLATDISASSCLVTWVSGVSSTGTFVKHKNMTSLLSGPYGIPKGWTVVNDGKESEPNLITFTIDGTAYQAEEYVTWGQWVTSKYNTQGFYISKDYIRASNGDLLTQNQGQAGVIVYVTDVIMSSYIYTTWNETFD